MFDNYVQIKEEDLARRFEKSIENVTALLQQLNNMQVINYLPRNDSPKVTFIEARMNAEELAISREHLIERKKRYYEKMNAVLDFVENTSQCRSILLLSYFGENTSYRCGMCDFCLKRNKLELNDLEFDSTEDEIMHLLKEHPMKLDQLISHITTVHEDKALKVIDWMLENEKIRHVAGNSIEKVE